MSKEHRGRDSCTGKDEADKASEDRDSWQATRARGPKPAEEEASPWGQEEEAPRAGVGEDGARQQGPGHRMDEDTQQASARTTHDEPAERPAKRPAKCQQKAKPLQQKAEIADASPKNVKWQ